MMRLNELLLPPCVGRCEHHDIFVDVCATVSEAGTKHAIRGAAGREHSVIHVLSKQYRANDISHILRSISTDDVHAYGDAR